MQCQDEAKDTLPANANSQHVSKAQVDLLLNLSKRTILKEKAMKCVEGCTREMSTKLPKLKERLKAAFK